MHFRSETVTPRRRRRSTQGQLKRAINEPVILALWSHIAGHRCGRAISARIPHITHRAQRVHHAQQSSTAGVTTASRAISATMGPGSFREISSRYTAQYHFGQSRRRSACIESRTHTCVCIAQDCGVRALWVIGMRRAGAAHQVQSRARHFGHSRRSQAAACAPIEA